MKRDGTVSSQASSVGEPAKSRQRLSQSERRAQLLRGAISDAANVGLGRLTHAGVARECGVAVPTVFAHFENRTVLVKSTVEEIRRFYFELASYWHRPEIPARAAIEAHLNAYSASIATDRPYAQVWLEWSTAVRNEFGIWDSYIAYHNSLMDTLAATIRRGQKQGAIGRTVNPPDGARMIIASAVGITQLHFMRRDKKEIARFVAQSIHRALDD